MQLQHPLTWVLATLALLSGCGGGGGGSSPPPANPAPTVSLSASPTAVTGAATSLLTWSSTNATSCTASGPWSGTRATSGSEPTPPVPVGSGNFTYTLTCSGAGGTASASATVTVTAAYAVTLSATLNPVNAGQTTTLNWDAGTGATCTASGGWSGPRPATGSEVTATLTTATLFTLSCTGPSGSATANLQVAVNSLPPLNINFFAPSLVFSGRTIALDWNVLNATSCTASGGWSGAKATSGHETITAPTVTVDTSVSFTLTCTGPGGTASQSVTSIVRPLIPVSVTVSARPTAVTAGSRVQVNWAASPTELVDSCTASGSWSGSRAASSQELLTISADASFVLTCATPGGPVSGSASVSFLGANRAPIADAGADITVFGAEGAALNGFNSSDVGGGIDAQLTYTWTQISGPVIRGVQVNGSFATFTVPITATEFVAVFQLVVKDEFGLTSSPDTVQVTVKPPRAGITSLHGRITNDRAPFSTTLGSGLDFSALRREPVREVELRVLQNSRLLDTVFTDTDGNYTVDVASGATVQLQPIAHTVRQAPQPLPHWDIWVGFGDTAAFAIGGFCDTSVTPSGASATLDCHMAVPGTASAYFSSGRFAAPFAILDTVYRARQLVLSAQPDADFPALRIDWSPSNTGGNTFYDPGNATRLRRIVLSGEAFVDTDEFDAHVIAHEFGHYVEDVFARSDSIGGPHVTGDKLDPRVAFAEGFGYAFAAMALNDPVPRDSFGSNASRDGFFNVETDSTSNEGWYSEDSAGEILYDLFDSADDTSDTLSLGFGPIWRALHGVAPGADAYTSLFQFMSALRAQNAGLATQIDTLIDGENTTSSGIEPFASTETHNAGVADVLPVYSSISINGGPVIVSSLGSFGTFNKLGVNRFLRLNVPSAQRIRITASTVTGLDADVFLVRRGLLVASGVADGDESVTADVTPGTYIIETYDCANVGCSSNTPQSVLIRINVVSIP